jgi:hypothetical protein
MRRAETARIGQARPITVFPEASSIAAIHSVQPTAGRIVDREVRRSFTR